jgi:iron-sulfur cluster assembly accessory protein
MIVITSAAASKLIELAKAEDKPSTIRIAIQGGGCSGFQYAITFDEFKEGDEISEFGAAKVFVDPMSLMYLDGSTIDWIESLEGSGFSIANPNATGKCGCGHSFEA